MRYPVNEIYANDVQRNQDTVFIINVDGCLVPHHVENTSLRPILIATRRSQCFKCAEQAQLSCGACF